LQVNGLVNSLEKYRLLTPLIARRPDVLAVYSNNRDDEDVTMALEALSQIGGMSGAAEIELTFVDGGHLSVRAGAGSRNLVSSSAPLMREDVQQAFTGRLGRSLLINRVGRFYIFSSAVRINGAVVGVVSVHVDLGQTEQEWALSEKPIIAQANGHVFLSNQEVWLDAALHPDAPEFSVVNSGTDLIMRDSYFGPLIIEWKEGSGQLAIAGDYVAAQRTDPMLGWTFFAMEPLRGPVFVAATACLTSTLFAGLVLGSLWVAFNRQHQQLVQRRKDMASSLALERRVRARTRELRKTQEGLIHSAKLAAIGQMSAVLSHEFNQPLAAIRSYTDNAQLLFASGREEQGQDNLSRVARLVDRLAGLSKSLKSFARKPGVGLKAISVERVVDEAVMLMLPQARKCGAELSVVRARSDLFVMAGHTRLEQVLINLVANSLDAISEGKAADGKKDRLEASVQPIVQILISRRGSMGVIEVSDNGSGIGPERRGEIFEPFVTSKGHGVGLGLGLPIAYNLVKGFGGTLSCIEPTFASMATAFEIKLPLAGNEENGMNPRSSE
uniref:sensor histidine kinase n=1 Tax=Cohaesibacter celericrescens TaxID=2067669 RepID=UPI003563D0DB